MDSPKISVIIPVFNERQNIRPLVEQLNSSLPTIDSEIIFVDDGSNDGTLEELSSVASDRIKVIELRKNYGQSLALMAGIDNAKGDIIVTLDGDLQNDCSDILPMIKILEEGDWDMVTGEREKRKDSFFIRKLPSLIANWIIRSTSGIKLKDYGCALKVFKSEIGKSLGLYGELHRFIPVLAHLEGARITQVKVKHHPRKFGKTKYGLSRTIKVISDLLLMLFFKQYLQRPMHLFGNLGVWSFIFGAIINLYLIFLKLCGHDIWGKPLMILGLMLVIGGIQFITIGIVVEIQVRTYFESQQKRPYKIRRILK